MKHYHSLFGLLICLWIHLNLNQTCAANIPNPSLHAKPPTAGSLATPDFDNSVLNLTSLGAVDPAFGFVPIFSGDKLRPIPCLLNSVNVALQLGLEDYEGFMFETVFRLESHPQVEIAVIPDEEGGSIPRKYAVWGLNAGIGMSFRSPSSFLVWHRRRSSGRRFDKFNCLCASRRHLVIDHPSSKGQC